MADVAVSGEYSRILDILQLSVLMQAFQGTRELVIAGAATKVVNGNATGDATGGPAQ